MSKSKLGMTVINTDKIFLEHFKKHSENRKIHHLVLHHVGAKNCDEAIDLFKKYGVSAHYIIDKNGEIFQLVKDHNIAWHAGVSYWDGVDGLNSSSIGIEFFSPDPFKIGFSNEQMQSGLKLCQDLVKKYQIKAKNIVAHSDIGFDRKTGLLNRKQDPSHLFNWKFLSENGIGLYPKINEASDAFLFQKGDKSDEIAKIKENLSKFGYKVSGFSDIFDEEMEMLTTVFNRRFNQNAFKSAPEIWYKNSSLMLEGLLKILDK